MWIDNPLMVHVPKICHRGPGLESPLSRNETRHSDVPPLAS